MPQKSKPQRSSQERLSEVGNGASEVIEQATKRLQDMSMEPYRFAQEAVGLSMSAMNRMVGCRSIGELAEVQRDYLKEAIDQAFDASRRMYGMGTDMAEEVGGTLPKSIQDAIENAARKREDLKETASGKR